MTSTIATNEIATFCDRHDACREGREWALDNCATMQEAWEKCATPDWLVWIATRPGVLPDRELRLFACFCARQVWHLLTDPRSRTAVEVAERFAAGEANETELDAAWVAAEAAADAAAWAAAHASAADAAWVDADAAAWTAAWAAAWTAAHASAADAAATDAAWAAADAAAADADAADADAADADAADALWAAQAQYLRANCKPNFE